MGRFSQRVAGRPLYTSGLNEASPNLRVAAWNLLHVKLFPHSSEKASYYRLYGKELWVHLNWTIDTLPYNSYDGQNTIKQHWMSVAWDDFFDIFEFAVDLLAPRAAVARNRADWFDEINELLQDQGCAYRFIAEELAPITNALEVEAVATAADCTIGPVGQHIREALALLPPSKDSSPRNSVKESISAVEGALKHLTGEPAATLGEGLKEFEKAFGPLHESIRRGLTHLYAYTNQPDGIRHALIEDSREVTVDDARFMVITCSAFANYLVAIAAKHRP